MAHVFDGTGLPQHGMFFMESAGGYHPVRGEPEEQHQSSCFGLEEEKGVSWAGKCAARPALSESKPTL